MKIAAALLVLLLTAVPVRAQLLKPPCPPQGCNTQYQNFESRLVQPPPQQHQINEPVEYQRSQPNYDVQPPKDRYPPSPEICRSVVRITAPGTMDGGPIIMEGSGTVVDVQGDECLVLSCAHIVDDSNPDANFTIHFSNGQTATAKKTLTDQYGADLSAFIVPAQPGIKPVPVASDEPRPREVCTSMGYGQFNENLAYFNGIFIDFCNAMDKKGRQHQELNIAGACRGGDSGGPIFNARWEVCGVIHCVDNSKDPRYISGPSNRPLRSFLQRVRARWLTGRQQVQQKVQQKVEQVQERIQQRTGPLVAVPPKPNTGGGSGVIDKVEGVAKGMGTSWLTSVFVGLGLSSNPAGWLAFAAMSGLSFFLHRKIKKMKGEQPPTIAEAAGDALASRAKTRIGKRIVRRFATKAINKVAPDFSELLQQIENLKQQIETIPSKVTHIIEPPEMPDSMVVKERYHVKTVEVPENREAKAWAEAIQRYINRYPGSATTLTAVQSVKDQILAGQTPT